ncbi:MAG: acyltransferase [Polyangiaceae bacterium]
MKRQPALDGLRGIALLTVLCFHFSGPFQSSAQVGRTMERVLASGWIGVELFFALSGFLITRSLLELEGPWQSRLLVFWRNRALRIFPAYFAFLIGCSLLDAVPRPSYWVYLSNWVQPSMPSEIYSYRSHLWSLAVEEQFYFLWPAAVLGLTRPKLVKLCIGVFLVSASLRAYQVHIGASDHFIYRATCFRMDSLALGSLAALVPGAAMNRSLALGGAALLATIVTARSLAYDDSVVQWLGYPALALLFAGLVAATSRGWAERVLRHPLFTMCGKYSYGAYLLHWPLAMALWKPVSAARLTPAAMMGLVALEVGVTLVMAFCVYHGLEKHFLRLKAQRVPARTEEEYPTAEPVTTR